MRWFIYPFLFFFFLLIAFCSCRRYASIYQLRKPALKASDSIYWYDSVFYDEKYILDTLLDGRFSRNAFNGNVICAYHGKVFYERSIGYANLFDKDSLSITNAFQLASVSKPFTATAILQLCEKGKLNLQDTLGKFFPGFPYKGITVKMLLCHRSGLPNYLYFTDKYFKKNPPKTITNDSVIALMYHLKPRAYAKPNEVHDYSNTGFMLLASIVERVTGDSFETYLQNYIFKPCKMYDTYVYNLNKVKESVKSVKAFEDDELVAETYHNGVIGDKGIYSTVYDLLKFDKALKSGMVLGKQWQDSAFTRHNPDWEGPNNYGLGWRLRTGYGNEKIVYHSGWWKGFRSLFVRDLTRDLTIVIMDNVRNNGFIMIDDLLWVFDTKKNSFVISESVL